MLINFVDATNDANHYTKPPPIYIIATKLHKSPEKCQSLVLMRDTLTPTVITGENPDSKRLQLNTPGYQSQKN